MCEAKDPCPKGVMCRDTCVCPGFQCHPCQPGRKGLRCDDGKLLLFHFDFIFDYIFYIYIHMYKYISTKNGSCHGVGPEIGMSADFSKISLRLSCAVEFWRVLK